MCKLLLVIWLLYWQRVLINNCRQHRLHHPSFLTYILLSSRSDPLLFSLLLRWNKSHSRIHLEIDIDIVDSLCIGIVLFVRQLVHQRCVEGECYILWSPRVMAYRFTGIGVWPRTWLEKPQTPYLYTVFPQMFSTETIQGRKLFAEIRYSNLHLSIYKVLTFFVLPLPMDINCWAVLFY